MFLRRSLINIGLGLCAVLIAPTCQYSSDDPTSAVSGGLPFELLLPLDGDTGVLPRPQLSWNALTGATSYRLQLSTTSDFAALIWDDASLTLPTVVLPPTLVHSRTFFWRVYGTTSTGAVLAGGSPRRFTTIGPSTGLPDPFTLFSPAIGVNGVPRVPEFQWNASYGEGSYTLRICTDAAMAQVVAEVTDIPLNRAICPVTLSPLTTYFWHVTAMGGPGLTRLSSLSPRTFITGP